MEYKEYLKEIKGFSENTIKSYVKYAEILISHKGDYIKALNNMGIKTNNTRRLVLSSFKSYYKYEGDIRTHEIELPKKDQKVHDFVSYTEYKNYLSSINKRTKMGFQKYIILRILFETGIRSFELLSIEKIHIRDSEITIKGKGNKERVVKVSEWLANDLNEYISSVETSSLFNFGYRNLLNKISLLDKTRPLSPHMFRRGYAKYCYQNNISIYDIALSMGHSSINTTATYISKKSSDIDISHIF